MLAGGRACRPLIARDGLARPLWSLRIALLRATGVPVQFGHRLRALSFDGQRVAALDFGEDTVQLGPDDAVILAVPPTVAAALLPGLQTPDEFRAIVNAHYRVDPPAGCRR